MLMNNLIRWYEMIIFPRSSKEAVFLHLRCLRFKEAPFHLGDLFLEGSLTEGHIQGYIQNPSVRNTYNIDYCL